MSMLFMTALLICPAPFAIPYFMFEAWRAERARKRTNQAAFQKR